MRTILIIIIVFSAACASTENKVEKNQTPAQTVNRITLTEEQIRNGGIESGIIGKQALDAMLRVNGVADAPPQNIVSVSFPLGGYLRQSSLVPGMYIKKGGVLAVIEDNALIQLQQDYLMAKAKLGQLDKEYQRQQLLRDHQVNAEKVWQQAGTDLESQKLLVKGYSEKLKLVGMDPGALNETNLSRSVALHAPIAGYVSKVNVNTGKYVHPTDILFELIDPSEIHATLTVFEKDIAKIMIGQAVRVSLANDPGKIYPAKIRFINRNIDQDRTALVHCHFGRAPAEILPGMYLKAEIVTGGVLTTVVPEKAVVRYGADEYLVEDLGNRNYALVQVSTGLRDAGRVEVNSKDKDLEGKKIVITNPYPILSMLRNKTD